ncbi:MAG: sulfite exporter TauE/SafE family protein [Ruminococcaceae bacterium]|nr:sulfite exporter TauE/SafE family protein [Oscillospiraceae bacterium]
MARWMFVALVGGTAGFVNGLLGTGGGILLVFALNYMFKKADGKDIYATTLVVTLCMSAVSVFIYGRGGGLQMSECLKYGIAAVPGGLIGAYLLDRLNGKTVKRLFGVLLIVAGANMSGLF